MLDIGNSLKEHRQASGISQSELAKATGLKQQNISRWESNIHIPDILDCVKLADYYGISLDELVDRKKRKNYGLPTTVIMRSKRHCETV